MNECETAYRDWLVSEMDSIEGKSYKYLLNEMYRHEFCSLVKYDEDRAADGIALRSVWSEANDNCDTNFGPAKILEVLIGIAMRVEFQLFGSKWADEFNYKKIFWVMVDNLGLTDFDGVIFLSGYEIIVTNLENFCHRKYTCDGFGNIFYIFEAEKDMRKLSIWAQMGLFIRDKWPI